MRQLILIITFCLCFCAVFCQKKQVQTFHINNNLKYEYYKPTFFEMIKYLPKDVGYMGKYLIQKENIKPVALATVSTIILVPLDSQLTKGANKLGSYINLDNEGTYTRISGVRFTPNNFPSMVYYMGNGGTPLILSAGFYAFGKINNDYRALTTASELIEVISSVGVVTQTIKRITGRQSPIKVTNGGSGHWTPFPSFNAYQKNTPNYDAMPSGHLATYMAAFTVISTNYPEKKWIKPVGYSIASLLAFQMVSSEVHWTSDYPIAILVGYVIGKKAAKRRIKEIHTKTEIPNIKKTEYQTSFNMSSSFGTPLVGITINF